MSSNSGQEGTTISCAYRGQQKSLFKLVAVNAFLTLITLGIYRFWAKTRVRKYFWSATAPGNDPMEYTGNGLEKLLGFLIAVAFLTVYLGIFQLLLSFVGMSVFNGGSDPDDIALQIGLAQLTLLAITPFIFYAQYRARRYVLSRTRWRSIRFGADAAAWGYVWRAIGHSILTFLSLGLLLPRQTFWLEKYKIDRTWYGDAKFHQDGKWTMLYPAMKHIFIALGIMVATAALIFTTKSPGFSFFFFVGGIWFYVGIVFYSVHSFRILTAHKTLDDTVTFTASPSTGTVFKAIILGGFLTAVCAGLLFAVFAGLAGMLMGGMSGMAQMFEPSNSGMTGGPGQMAGMVIFIIGYVAMLMASSAFAMIFIVQPILAHYVRSTQIHNSEALFEITQRAGDDMVEAEGFADALDVGSAF